MPSSLDTIMKSEESTYSLELSSAELRWLAGTLGLIHLPFSDDNLRNLSCTDAGLSDAQASLQRRGLIHRAAGLGWEVDRLPTAIIRWLGTADKMLSMETYLHDGNSRRVYSLVDGKIGMSVTPDSDVYRFVLYQSIDALLMGLMNSIGAPRADTQPDSRCFDIPQPMIIIPTAWRDSNLAKQILQRSGVERKKTDILSSWLVSLRWAAALTSVQLGTISPESKLQNIVCSGPKGLWLCKVSKASELCSFTCMTYEDVRLVLRNLL